MSTIMSTIVFNQITEDAESTEFVSSGNMVFSVNGRWKGGSLVFEIDLGAGYVVAGSISHLSPRAFPIIIPAGVTFKIKADTILTDENGVTVEFIDV
jgi:hypothetical protein